MPSTKRRFVVSVDTEEDIWGWSSEAPITCENAARLPALARFFERIGVRPTFFVTYRVLSDPTARAVMRELDGEEWIEVGCHVHPWNTPPYDDSPRRTMLYNYPTEVQAAKIAAATDLFDEVLGRRPTSFRAGRFGFGSSTAEILLDQGYQADSSVTPFFDWTESSEGQNYVGAPLEIYRIDAATGVLSNAPSGGLIEVPLTAGYTRLQPGSWESVARFLDRGPVRAVHVGSIGARLLGLRRAILSPEAHPVRDMVALGRRVAEAGVGHLHLFFHSSSLVPGLTPFARTSGDVERLYDRMEEVWDLLGASFDLQFVSVAQAAAFVPAEPAEASRHQAGRMRATASISPAPASSAPAEPAQLDWSGPPGLKARLVHMARQSYWKLGGYRRFQRVRWESVRRLVFVCTGNICRSPYAEHVARSQGVDAVSLGVRTRRDGPANETALRVARTRGIVMDGHRTTPVDAFEAREGDLFIAMEPFQAALLADQPWSVPHQVTLLGLWASSHGPVIPDPYGQDDDYFAQCFSIIERGVEGVRSRIAQTANPTSSEVISSHDAS